MNKAPWTPADLKLLKNLTEEGKTTRQISDLLSRSYDSVSTKARRLGLVALGLPAKLPKLPLPKFGRLSLDHINAGDWVTFGLVGDTHLACKEERLAELHTQY